MISPISCLINIIGKHDYCVLIYCYALPVIRVSPLSAPTRSTDRTRVISSRTVLSCLHASSSDAVSTSESEGRKFMAASPFPAFLVSHCSSLNADGDDDGSSRELMMIRDTE